MLGVLGQGLHLGLCLLSGAPSALLLLAGSGRRLGSGVLRGPLGTCPQVFSALSVLELGAPQSLHCLILGGNKRTLIRPRSASAEPQSLVQGPPTRGLTMRFCSFSHCSLNSFLHFSISILLAARGCRVEDGDGEAASVLPIRCFLPHSPPPAWALP